MLMLDAETRKQLWAETVGAIEDYTSTIANRPVGPVNPEPEEIRALLKPLNFAQKMKPSDALQFVLHGLSQHQVHPAHPRYFGLFNPGVTTMGVLAETIAATFNSQLAVWGHCPFGVEIENHLLQAFGERFGFQQTDGTFTSGGSEANHTGILTALTHAFPAFGDDGIRALPNRPVLYVSSEGHHSIIKAARLCGLGNNSVRVLEATPDLQLNVTALREQVALDRREGYAPFLVVGTAGTTNAGIVDPLDEISRVAREERMWFHVDAAWGGAAVIVPELRGLLAGIEKADSITFDAHKWLSVPFNAGMFLTRHRHILDRSFRIDAPYVPQEHETRVVTTPLAHSMFWGRLGRICRGRSPHDSHGRSVAQGVGRIRVENFQQNGSAGSLLRASGDLRAGGSRPILSIDPGRGLANTAGLDFNHSHRARHSCTPGMYHELSNR